MSRPIQILQTLWQIHFNPPARNIDLHTYRPRKRDKQVRPHFQQSRSSAIVPPGDNSQRLPRSTLHDLTTGQVAEKKLARLERQPLLARDSDFRSTPALRVRHRIDTPKLEQQRPGRCTHRLHLHLPRRQTAAAEQIHPVQALKTLLMIAERDGYKVATQTPCARQHGDRNPVGILLLISRRNRYSKISRVKRRLSFMPAAPRIVRIERAVRPCFPITFPKSLGATRNSKTVTCSPSTACTETPSGMSTRAFAISSINSFTRRLPRRNCNSPLIQVTPRAQAAGRDFFAAI